MWEGDLGIDGLEDDSVRALAEDLALLVAIRQELPSCIVVPAAAVAGARHGERVHKHLRLTPGGRRRVRVGRRALGPAGPEATAREKGAHAWARRVGCGGRRELWSGLSAAAALPFGVRHRR